jgi:hypothetical protein
MGISESVGAAPGGIPINFPEEVHKYNLWANAL